MNKPALFAIATSLCLSSGALASSGKDHARSIPIPTRTEVRTIEGTILSDVERAKLKAKKVKGSLRHKKKAVHPGASRTR